MMAAGVIISSTPTRLAKYLMALPSLKFFDSVLRAKPGTGHAPHPNRSLERSLAFSASLSRSRAGACVCSDARRGRGGGGPLRDRAVERLGVGLRRLVEAGEFSHELHGGSVDFILGRGRFEIEQRLDVTAHFFFSFTRPTPRGFVPAALTSGTTTESKTCITAHFGIEWAQRLSPRRRPVPAKQASAPCPM